jgi:hypothetical protein
LYVEHVLWQLARRMRCWRRQSAHFFSLPQLCKLEKGNEEGQCRRSSKKTGDPPGVHCQGWR